MKLIVASLAFALTLSPAVAQQSGPVPPVQPDDGFSLMEEGAKLLFRGLMTELEPTFDDMGKALSQIEPTLRDLEPKLRQIIGMVDDLRNYHAPELLENGDIIMRRKLPSELPPAAPETEL